jgi:putative two-component system response regulator
VSSRSVNGRTAISERDRVRVLCVDDEPDILKLMTRLLERLDLSVTTASGPQPALDLFDHDRFDLVITDIRMPGMDGHAFLAEIRNRDPQVPVIVATGHASLDNAIRALRDGASGMLVKPFTAEEFGKEVTAALERARIRHDALRYQYVTPILDGVALALTAAIEARDLETGEHCRQLGWMGERVARLMGLPELEQTTIRIGGYLHDVGKIAIADRILLKPGPLTDEEYTEMQRHADIGAKIVSTHEAMTGIAQIVRHHHERFDGHGYPDRLAGDAVPLGARIISIADALSAMTSDRPYRKAIALEPAWEEIVRNSGSQFDPAVVEIFGTMVERDLLPEATGIDVSSKERPVENRPPVRRMGGKPDRPGRALELPGALDHRRAADDERPTMSGRVSPARSPGRAGSIRRPRGSTARRSPPGRA